MNLNKLVFKNALKITLGIVLYYFLMKIFGLEQIVELRYLNFLFVVWGINSSIKTNININQENVYISNLFLGIFTSVLAVFMTIIFLITYVSLFSTNLIEILENSFLWGNNLSLPLIIFALLIEGIASSVICSFILMQYWKNYKITKVSI